MNRTTSEHENFEDVISRFMWLGKATLAVMVLLLPVVMIQMPFFSFADQFCLALKLAGIVVMSAALCWGCLVQLRLWWRDVEARTLERQGSRVGHHSWSGCD